MGILHRKSKEPEITEANNSPPGTAVNEKLSKYPSPENPSKRHVLPTFEQDGRLITKGIHPDGESGRSGFHPLHFCRVTWKSATTFNSYLNILWPFVPAAIVLHFAAKEHHLAIFAVNYVAMVPCASLLGFAGQEFARKLPKVAGILIETALGGVVEIVLFAVLINKDTTYENPEDHPNDTGSSPHLIPVIQAAILGSILTNLLLCLGGCFVAGGIRHKEQQFHPAVSEVGSGILLVAGFGLLIPSAFYTALSGHVAAEGQAGYSMEKLLSDTRGISRATSIILMVTYALFILYNAVSHDSIFEEVLAGDEERDHDRDEDLAKSKYTMFEACLAIVISIALISLISVFLVEQIEYIVENQHVPDNFMGLILVPLVEKVAEHLTAVDEAWDNQINFALYHCLGPSVQTALFNAPLVVMIGWGMGKEMDLNFEIFMVVLLVLSILVVGNFLRDGSSNYLEGSLLLAIYVIIAVTTSYYPNANVLTTNGPGTAEGTAEGTSNAIAKFAARAVMG